MREPGARGRADTVSVYAGMGNILAVKTAVLLTQSHKITC